MCVYYRNIQSGTSSYPLPLPLPRLRMSTGTGSDMLTFAADTPGEWYVDDPHTEAVPRPVRVRYRRKSGRPLCLLAITRPM